MRRGRRLAEDQVLLVPRKVVMSTFDSSMLEDEELCPFCFEESRLREFLRMNKKGQYLLRVVCPKCKEVMLLRTLRMSMSVKELAGWVFSYNVHGAFFRKANFFRFNQRLKDLGIASEFWDEYHRLKGVSPHVQSYGEWVEAEQIRRHSAEYSEEHEEEMKDGE